MAEKTLMDILKSMSEEQQQAVYAIVGEVLAHTGVGDNANDVDEDELDLGDIGLDKKKKININKANKYFEERLQKNQRR